MWSTKGWKQLNDWTITIFTSLWPLRINSQRSNECAHSEHVISSSWVPYFQYVAIRLRVPKKPCKSQSRVPTKAWNLSFIWQPQTLKQEGLIPFGEETDHVTHAFVYSINCSWPGFPDAWFLPTPRIAFFIPSIIPPLQAEFTQWTVCPPGWLFFLPLW